MLLFYLVSYACTYITPKKLYIYFLDLICYKENVSLLYYSKYDKICVSTSLIISELEGRMVLAASLPLALRQQSTLYISFNNNSEVATVKIQIDQVQFQGPA